MCLSPFWFNFVISCFKNLAFWNECKLQIKTPMEENKYTKHLNRVFILASIFPVPFFLNYFRGSFKSLD